METLLSRYIYGPLRSANLYILVVCLTLETRILRLCQARGFLCLSDYAQAAPSFESCHLGPLGAKLKRNISNEWYYSVVTSRGDVYLLEPEESASEGRSPHTRPHPVSVKCLLTEEVLPFDDGWKLDSVGGNMTIQAESVNVAKDWISKIRNTIVPSAKVLRRANKILLYVKEMNKHNIVLSGSKGGDVCFPHVGIASPSGSPFLEMVQSTSSGRGDLVNQVLTKANLLNKSLRLSNPFGFASISDCADLYYVSDAHDSHEIYLYWQKSRLRWWKRHVNDPEKLTISELSEEIGSHKTCCIQYIGLPGCAALERITHFDCTGSVALVHASLNLAPALQAVLFDAFREVNLKPHLRMHTSLSPYKVAVLTSNPSSKQQVEISKQIAAELRAVELSTKLHIAYPLSDACEEEDESGTPYCIIVTDDTLSSGLVSLRYLTTAEVEQIHIHDLLQTFSTRLKLYRPFKQE